MNSVDATPAFKELQPRGNVDRKMDHLVRRVFYDGTTCKKMERPQNCCPGKWLSEVEVRQARWNSLFTKNLEFILKALQGC